jgi:phosphopantetheinyl transferase
MMLDEKRLELALSSRLDAKVKVAASSEAVTMAALTAAESARLDQIDESPRRADWLTGRGALKRLLAMLGEDPDTSKIDFPNPRVSLTHSGGTAVAVGTLLPLSGVGVDLELYRDVNSEAARFFLTREEKLRWMEEKQSEHARSLLRLWTVKEALFKSHPSNSATMLADYVLEDPARHTGRATVAGSVARTFRYTSLMLPDAVLSAAVFP